MLCKNCNNTCLRLRRDYCDSCYSKWRRYGDPNYKRLGFSVILTEQQHNLIIGSMLGDGYLRRKKPTHNTYLNIDRKQEDHDYLVWQSKIMDNIINSKGVKSRSVYDKRTKKIYYKSDFSTKSTVELNDYHDKWYKTNTDKEIKQNFIKVVPLDLELNAEIIAIWFCDDGHIGLSGKRFYMTLATNSFTKIEVEFLIGLLEARYNEKFRLIPADTGYIIGARDNACRALIADIDSVFPNGMQRKRLWDDPAACFYSNQPPRLISVEEKEEKVWEYVIGHDEFYLMDIAKHLDWKFTRSDGTIEWDTQNTKRYLKEYVDSGLFSEELTYTPIHGIRYKKLNESV